MNKAATTPRYRPAGTARCALFRHPGRMLGCAAMVERTVRDVVASGVRLRVAEHGSGSPVVFLHGLYLDHSTWDGAIAELGGRFRCVVPDLPGFGESEKPPPSRFPYGLEAFLSVVIDLYAALGLGRAAVVGHGLGGAVAILVAARHPELVSKLVLVAPLCHAAPPDPGARVASLPLVGSLVVKQLWGRLAFRAFFRRWVFGASSEVPDARIDYYYDLFSSPAARGAALATLRAMGDSRSVVAHTQRIETPTLLVWGRADRIYPAALGQRLSREIRGARFELLDAGHAPQEERPEALGAVLGRFLGAGRLEH
jgi:pimeloyl-ACP methyl ester carboxylesterase